MAAGWWQYVLEFCGAEGRIVENILHYGEGRAEVGSLFRVGMLLEERHFAGLWKSRVGLVASELLIGISSPGQVLNTYFEVSLTGAWGKRRVLCD